MRTGLDCRRIPDISVSIFFAGPVSFPAGRIPVLRYPGRAGKTIPVQSCPAPLFLLALSSRLPCCQLMQVDAGDLLRLVDKFHVFKSSLYRGQQACYNTCIPHLLSCRVTCPIRMAVLVRAFSLCCCKFLHLWPSKEPGFVNLAIPFTAP